MKSLKRILALFLVLTLCFSLLPLSVLAEESDAEEVVQETEETVLPDDESGYEEGELPEESGEVDPPCRHDYVAVVTEPTCIEGGYTTYTCTLCGDEYVGNYTEALGHTPEDAAEVASTCTEHGHAAGVVCAVCGAVLSGCEELPLAEHSPMDVAEVPAEPGKPGTAAGVVCAVCGEILEGCWEIEPLPEAKEPDFPLLTAASGTCGENLTWSLDDDGTLTISGAGEMAAAISSAAWRLRTA